VGIPALYTSKGIDLVGKEKGSGKPIADSYTDKNYHRPSDEFDPATWVLDGAIQDLQLLFQVGKRLSYSATWPQWKQESEFRAVRVKSLGRNL
jgi:hypothetical protein